MASRMPRQLKGVTSDDARDGNGGLKMAIGNLEAED
jgi:hypothetical protein